MAKKSPPPKSRPSLSPSRQWAWAGVVIPILIALIGFAAYSNSLNGEFVLDDKRNIEGDLSVRTLLPTRSSLLGPPWTTFTGRPVTMFSFALGYQIHQTDPWGYHIVNIVIHILVGLVLFGVLRRTLRLPALQPRFSGREDWIAGIIALIWVSHPLCSSSVSYISQRAESLMGLFYLLTLYCFIHGTQSVRGRHWYVLTVVCCMLGLATKEPMASAPLIVLLYDRTLLAGSFVNAFRQRRALYIGLFATWLPFFGFLSLHPHGPDVALSFPDLSSFDYFKTQAWVLVRYLRQSFWPSSLVLYYGRANESVYILRRFMEYAPYGIVIVSLLAATFWALWRGKPIALLGMWFFLILAPSSTIVAMPTEVLAEYRMYLPLISVIGVVVFAADAMLKESRLRGAVAAVLTASIIIALTLATRQRNRAYATTISMWQDIADKMPNNVIALTNLGMFKYMAGNRAAAEADFQQALKLNAKSGAALAGLGMLLETDGKLAEAEEKFRLAMEYEPLSPESYLNLAMVYAMQQRYEQAVEVLSKAAEKIPWEQDLHIVHGAMLLRAGRETEGNERLDRAIAADFDHAQSAHRAGEILMQLNLPQPAEKYFQQAASYSSKNPRTYLTLAMLLTRQGKVDQAMEQYTRGLALSPNDLAALNNLAWYHATSPDASHRDGQKAVRYAQRVVQLTNRREPGAIDTLAAAHAEAGQFDLAQRTAQEAIALAEKAPDNPAVAGMKQRLELYRAGKPFRDQSLQSTTQGS